MDMSLLKDGDGAGSVYISITQPVSLSVEAGA